MTKTELLKLLDEKIEDLKKDPTKISDFIKSLDMWDEDR